ncbi:MAG: 16S rRNA (adenine(1518)-N(6)/adenine(1519)-N(6))-dimethyltransferase RsmA [Desulfotomaculum sp.]|nr:16S rRNA (adenine(1518)-N(6)/adenine(1519)-N(6))-dimethyltransferase RsmA [Desulfotomaculum sp.]MCL0081021.1 16S rRNA (adenine(1518)-N(6)/adenine(1519)-N(6))-dimethyltransferase RsmA [Peptococcaceae bacterium]
MSELSSLVKVKAMLNEHQFRIRKKLGQNFLIDANIITKIVQTAAVDGEDLVVEIGPGLGVLTAALAEKAAQVIAVEIDQKLLPVLKKNLAAYTNVALVQADALEVDFDLLVQSKTNGVFGAGAKSYQLVANLPYYITSPLIMHMLTNEFNLNTIVIMVQWEVAQRLTATPGNKHYGVLSVALQYYAAAEVAFKVPRTVFHPQPAVDSAVVQLKVRPQPAVATQDEKLFFKVVRAAFAYRRKTLLNSLAGSGFNLTKKQWTNLLKAVAIEPSRRGETLSLVEFAQLTDALFQILSINNK